MIAPKPRRENVIAMKMSVLGGTGLSVSRIGLGLAALGRPGYINLAHAEDLGGNYNEAAMEQHAHAVLDEAWRAGVRYFDAARSYGLAEKFLSSWLASRSIARGDIVIGSKWGYIYTAGWRASAEVHEVKDHILPVLQRQWTETQALLGNYLDLYQIHSATIESGALENAAVLDELARLKSRGVRIGLTITGPGQAATLRQAMAVNVDGMRLFQVVEATWNLLEPSVGPALSEAKNAGLGVLIKEALANGRLTQRNRDPAFAASLALLRSEAASRNISIDALALAACLAQPFTDCVLSGAASAAQLRSNLNADAVELDPATLARLATLAEPPETYWAIRKRLPWN